VTYKDGVYDVTRFLELHPGGAQRLMLAAGGAIDPFWAMYQQHNNDQVGRRSGCTCTVYRKQVGGGAGVRGCGSVSALVAPNTGSG
jgi:hypothetical protein